MNHLSNLSSQLRDLADELNEPPTAASGPTTTERILAAAVAIESLPCDHSPRFPDSDQSWCMHCRTNLVREWRVDEQNEPEGGAE